MVKELRAEVEQLNVKRKRDKTAQDIELKGLKRRLGGVFDNSDVVLKGMEHLTGVLQTILESEQVQAALEFQDGLDRQRIALVGMKAQEAGGGVSPGQPGAGRRTLASQADERSPVQATPRKSMASARGGGAPVD